MYTVYVQYIYTVYVQYVHVYIQYMSSGSKYNDSDILLYTFFSLLLLLLYFSSVYCIRYAVLYMMHAHTETDER